MGKGFQLLWSFEKRCHRIVKNTIHLSQYRRLLFDIKINIHTLIAIHSHVHMYASELKYVILLYYIKTHTIS